MKDGYASWLVGLAVLREMRVRLGIYQPRDENERRQAAEGPRRIPEFDCLKDEK